MHQNHFKVYHFRLCAFRRDSGKLTTGVVNNFCDWVFYVNPFLSQYGWGIARTANVLASWMMVLVAMQRYLVICQPSFGKRWANLKSMRIWVLLICLFGVIYDVPFFVEKDITYNNISERYDEVTHAWASTEAYQVGYVTVSYGIVIILAPVAILCFTTYQLIKVVKQARAKRIQLMRNSERLKSREDITLSLIVVVIVYIICQIPNPLRYLILLFTSNTRHCSFFWLFENLALTAAILNSAINFLVYCLCAKRFRQKVLHSLKCRRKNKVFPIERSQATTTLPLTISARIDP